MVKEINGLVIPKYGMVMAEGVIAAWHVEEGAAVSRGEELVDIETEKVTNCYESPCSGTLRRKLVPAGESAPIGALFAVIAGDHIEDAEIDAYVEEFRANFSATQSQVSQPTAEIAEIGSGRIRFLKKGDGAGHPIVLVHGFGGDLNSWLLNQDALAESHPVYAIDLPGHGGSQKLQGVDSIDELASALGAFLDVQGLTKVHLVGHSLGGGISAKLALDRPERVASLTLLAPIGLGKEINADFIQGLVKAERRVEMKRVLEDLFHDRTLVSQDMVKNVLQSKRIDGAADSLKRIAEGCIGTKDQRTSLREALVQLSTPMLILWGLSDQIIPSAHAENLPDRIRVHRMDDVGHMAHMERSGDVNRFITSFIGECERAATAAT